MSPLVSAVCMPSPVGDSGTPKPSGPASQPGSIVAVLDEQQKRLQSLEQRLQRMQNLGQSAPQPVEALDKTGLSAFLESVAIRIEALDEQLHNISAPPAGGHVGVAHEVPSQQRLADSSTGLCRGTRQAHPLEPEKHWSNLAVFSDASTWPMPETAGHMAQRSTATSTQLACAEGLGSGQRLRGMDSHERTCIPQLSPPPLQALVLRPDSNPIPASSKPPLPFPSTVPFSSAPSVSRDLAGRAQDLCSWPRSTVCSGALQPHRDAFSVEEAAAVSTSQSRRVVQIMPGEEPELGRLAVGSPITRSVSGAPPLDHWMEQESDVFSHFAQKAPQPRDFSSPANTGLASVVVNKSGNSSNSSNKSSSSSSAPVVAADRAGGWTHGFFDASAPVSVDSNNSLSARSRFRTATWRMQLGSSGDIDDVESLDMRADARTMACEHNQGWAQLPREIPHWQRGFAMGTRAEPEPGPPLRVQPGASNRSGRRPVLHDGGHPVAWDEGPCSRDALAPMRTLLPGPRAHRTGSAPPGSRRQAEVDGPNPIFNGRALRPTSAARSVQGPADGVWHVDVDGDVAGLQPVWSSRARDVRMLAKAPTVVPSSRRGRPIVPELEYLPDALWAK